MKTTRDVRLLSPAEALLLNSASQGEFPIDCYFRSEAAYRLCFGEPWHRLDPKESLLTIARLMGDDLLYIERKELLTSAPVYGKQVIFVGLTLEGGAVWADFCKVNWNFLIWTEAGEELSTESSYKIRAVNNTRLQELADTICASTESHNFKFSPIKNGVDWHWSNWKSFGTYFELNVAVKKRDSGIAFKTAEEFLFSTISHLSNGFKQLPMH